MPTLRERALGVRDSVVSGLGGVAGKRLRELEAQQAALVAAIKTAPWEFTREQLLRELDSGTASFLMGIEGYEMMGDLYGQGGDLSDEMRRLAEVDQSRWLYRYDVNAWTLVTITTDFSVGHDAKLIPKDKKIAEQWSEFWDDRRNQSVLSPESLRRWSDALLCDGELFAPLFVSRVDARTTVRMIRTEEIKEIICDPDDDETPLYYRREYMKKDATGIGKVTTTYYQDWAATPEQLKRAVLPDNAEVTTLGDRQSSTDVLMIHLRLRDLGNRGWPLLGRARPWAHGYRNFLQNRLTLSKAVATFFEDVEIQGGGRAVSDYITNMRSSLTTGTDYIDRNPPPAAGSQFVHNQQMKRTRQPLTTGAGDAATDGMTILSQAGQAGRLPPMWLGRPDAMQNRATAEVTLLPSLTFWSNYAGIWGNAFRAMLEVVARAHAKVGPGKETDLDLTAEYSTAQPLEIEIDRFAGVLQQAIAAELIDVDIARPLFLNRPELALDDPEQVLADMEKRIEQRKKEADEAAQKAAEQMVATQPAQAEQPAQTKQPTQAEQAEPLGEYLSEMLDRILSETEASWGNKD